MARYRLLIGLSYPTDRRAVQRLLAGEDVPSVERAEHYAEAGAVVDDIPTSLIPRLLAKGRIERVENEAPAQESNDG